MRYPRLSELADLDAEDSRSLSDRAIRLNRALVGALLVVEAFEVRLTAEVFDDDERADAMEERGRYLLDLVEDPEPGMTDVRTHQETKPRILTEIP